MSLGKVVQIIGAVVDIEFSQDLYYYIAAFPINLPTLRERKSDISLLAEHLLLKSEFSSRSLRLKR